MATTPPEKKAQPPATPGFAAALFGGLFSTAKKKPRLVDSSTAPMASVTRTARVHHRRPDISLQSPSDNELATTDKVGTTSAIDLLDTEVPSASPEPEMDRSTPFPVKSPWKSPSVPAMNGGTTSGLQFSLGNLKAPPSERRSSLSQKSHIINRRRYRPSTLLVPARRRKTGPINPVNAVNALQNSQNLFRPSSKQAEARNNYTSFRVGKRLLGSSQRGGSRLASQVENEERPPSPVEPAIKRRKQVMFGDAVDATPIESEVVTPSRPPGQKRKGTPFKATSEASTPPVQVATPSTSRKPSVGPRPETKLLLEKGKHSFEESGEAKPLGSPVTSRTPLFMQNSSLTLRLPSDPTPKRPAKIFKGQVAKSSVEETSKPAPIDTFNLSSAGKTRVATFKCLKCQAETSTVESQCSKCGTARQVLTSGWGDLFADQKKRWKCAVCSVQNEQSASQCAACETPREGHESKSATSSSKDASVSKVSIGASGFSFGGGSAAPAPSTGGFTFSSQPATGKSLPSKEPGFSFASTTSSTSKGQGFTFGAAPTSTTGAGFTFGAATTSSASTGTASSSGGGFKFDVPAPSTMGGGFSFGSSPAQSTDKEKPKTPTGAGTSSSNVAPAAPLFGGSNKAQDENETSAPVFKFGSTSKPESENQKPTGFSFASSAPAPSVGNGVSKPFKFNVSGDEKKSEDAPKPNFAFHSTPSSPKKPSLSTTGTEATDKTSPPANGGSLNFPISNTNKSDLNSESSNKPVFSFGSSGGNATSASTGFSFGGTPAPRTSAEPTTVPAFNFSAPSTSSTESKALVPLGSIVNKDETDDDRSKRRRSRENDGATSAPTFGGTSNSTQAPTPAFTFGSSAPAPTTFGSQPQNDTPGIVFGGSAPSNPAGGFSFGAAPAPSASSTFKFGDSSSSAAPTFASDSDKALAFGQGASGSAPLFGSSQASIPSFGSAAPAPASTSNPFGSSSTASSTFSFGSAPAPAPSFGATPAPAPSFGSTSAPAPSFGSGPTPAPSFGSTPAPAPTFGSTPAPPPSFGSTAAPAPSFGSTPAQAPAPMFGSTPAAAPMFGSTPAPAPMFGNTPGTSIPQFGAAPTPGPGFGAAPASQGFGSSVSAPFGSAPADTSFGSAAPSNSGFGSAPSSFGAAPAPFGSTPGTFGGATPAQPSFGFGGAESGSSGFVSPAGGFGNQGGFSTPGAEAVQFSIGTGGGSKQAIRGRRPLLRAKRPTSGR